MPKVIPMIPDEMVLTRLSELDPLTCLVPRQVAMLMGKTEKQLEEARKAGSGPHFDSGSGRVVYFVGHVRAYLRDRMENQTYSTTAEAKRAKENRAAGIDAQAARKKSALGFVSLDQFLLYGEEDDAWPFAIIKGQPIDFFKSLGMELSDQETCEWLTLGEYFSMQQTAKHP